MTPKLATVRLVSPRVERFGLICLWAGLLGALSGLYLAFVPPQVGPELFGYPLAPGGHRAIQTWFALQHIGLILGIVGLASSGALGLGRLGRLGIGTALAGMVLLTVTELWAIPAAQAIAGSPEVANLEASYGLSTTLCGVGLVMAGIAVLRAGRWSGWARLVPLALGIYVFVPMFPAMVGSFLAARLAITGWMLLFAALGLALIRES